MPKGLENVALEVTIAAGSDTGWLSVKLFAMRYSTAKWQLKFSKERTGCSCLLLS